MLLMNQPVSGPLEQGTKINTSDLSNIEPRLSDGSIHSDENVKQDEDEEHMKTRLVFLSLHTIHSCYYTIEEKPQYIYSIKDGDLVTKSWRSKVLLLRSFKT